MLHLTLQKSMLIMRKNLSAGMFSSKPGLSHLGHWQESIIQGLIGNQKSGLFQSAFLMSVIL